MMRRALLLIVLMMVSSMACAEEGVVLLHGLARTARSMEPMAKSLREEGYVVLNLNYPSRSARVEELASSVRRHVIAETADWERVHVVTHSMGGILLRQIQATDPIPSLGRVVMLAPPNQGSEVVDALGGTWAFRLVNGPAGNQLGTGEDGIVSRLGPVDFELGVVAGKRSASPWLSSLIPGADDGKVAVERTKVEGMSDFWEASASHTFIMRNRVVMNAVKRFLRDGGFAEPAGGL